MQSSLELFQEIYDEVQDLEPVVCRMQTDGSKLIRKSQEPSNRSCGTCKRAGNISKERLVLSFEYCNIP